MPKTTSRHLNIPNVNRQDTMPYIKPLSSAGAPSLNADFFTIKQIIATIVNGIIRAEKMKVVDKTEIFTPKKGLNMPKVPPIRLATTRALKTREYISAI